MATAKPNIGSSSGASGSVPTVRRSLPSGVMRRLEVEQRVPEKGTSALWYRPVKRLTDLIVSVGLLVLLSPVMLGFVLYRLLKRDVNALGRLQKVGRHSRIFEEYTFVTESRYLRTLPVLFNVLRGDLSFIGPRAFVPEEMAAYDTDDPLIRRRHAVRPGLICDWWIRRHASLDYIQELPLDISYAESCSFRRDAGILLRAMPGLITALIWGGDPPTHASTIRILGIRIDNISMQHAVNRVVEMIDEDGPKHACFVNPHYINEAQRVPEYSKALAEADLVLADGFGTKLAGKILRRPLRQNLCGTDLFPRLCAALSGTGKRMYLLGAAPGVVDRVADWIEAHYPDLTVAGWEQGYFSEVDEPDVDRRIRESGADILVVAMGVPRQEVWINRHLDQIDVGVAMGFGGLFDYFGGRVPRAPQWVREMGMEWVYRLVQEPRRMWRRYLIGNGLFIFRVVKERFAGRASQTGCEIPPDRGGGR